MTIQEKELLIKNALKLQIPLLKIGTWLWSEQNVKLTDQQVNFLTNAGFKFSKGKGNYFLKGSNAVTDWGHYNAVSLKKIADSYGKREIYKQNYKKLVTQL
jgi:hypothetical protein